MDSCPVSNRDNSPLKTANHSNIHFVKTYSATTRTKLGKQSIFQSKLIALKRPLHLQPLELFIQENITVGPRVSVLGTLRLNFVWPITLTKDNQMNQSDIKPRTCPRRKAREKAYQQVTTGLKLNFDWPRKWRPNIVTKGLGCVPLG